MDWRVKAAWARMLQPQISLQEFCRLKGGRVQSPTLVDHTSHPTSRCMTKWGKGCLCTCPGVPNDLPTGVRWSGGGEGPGGTVISLLSGS